MKTLRNLLIFLAFITPFVGFSQTGPPAPGNGIYVIIDTTYQIGTSVQGQSKAKLTVQNSTTTLTTGYQFRIFYDKNAFSAASIALVGSSTNLSLQSVDNNANGYITTTVVYTGSSATYEIPDGERFEITFTHVSASSFYSLSTISDLTWTGSATFPKLASTQDGMDTTLTLHSYGGVWEKPELNFHGTFTNVTGTGAKNLTLALEKKVKTSGTWGQHASYTTDINGDFAFTELIDTTYYDVRLAIKGDTLSVGNVISTADAQLINQWVLGSATPSAWDFYTGDVNGSNNISITDAYGVFGRIAGRFSAWPNSVKDIKFFTSSQYATITGTPATNYTSSITGVTNFYYDIVAGQPDSVQFYVLVPGDANGTGYHMARLTPITILPTPDPNYPSELESVIDMSVEYDFPTKVMEISIPKIQVTEGNLVEIPITVKTNGEQITSLQLGLLYDENSLDFKEITNSDKSMFWMSSINATGGIIEWAGYDPSMNKSYMISDNYRIFTLNFIAKKPQAEWSQSPLWTSRKFSGDQVSKDMTITPSNGILIVAKMSSPYNGSEEENLVVYPNPTTGEFNINFTVKESGRVKLYIIDSKGELKKVILDKKMPAGTYTYSSNITNFAAGIYIATLQENKDARASKIIKQ
jgi:hypothetical protein